MYGNPQFEATRRRIRAWLAGEAMDRPVLLARVRPKQRLPEAATLRQAWLDPVFRLGRQRRDAARGGWLAEGMASFFVDLGPGALAAMLAGEWRLARETVWFPRAVEDLDEIPTLGIDRDGPAYRACIALTRRSLREGRGLWTTSITDIGGVTDVVASLRGNERLLLDLHDRPEAVRAAIAHVAARWREIFAELRAEIEPHQGGCASWLLPWTDGTHYPLQCDFSALIGPDAFEGFVLPELEALAALLDHPVYHLDGPDAVRHLPAVLSIERLRAVQWIPGAGAPPPAAWPDVIRTIRDAGRSVVTYGTPDEIVALTRRFGARGMLFPIEVESEEEGARLVRELERICRPN